MRLKLVRKILVKINSVRIPELFGKLVCLDVGKNDRIRITFEFELKDGEIDKNALEVRWRRPWE